MKDPGRLEKEAYREKGKMMVICGAKGGVGKTALALNLAIAFSKKGKKAALWDGDFQFGDIDISMDLQPTFTMTDVVEGIESLDAFTLESFMTKHDSGVEVLSSVKTPEYADLVTPSAISKAGELLLQLYDVVIVDAGTGFNDQSLSFIERADEILLVTTPELASIKSTKLMLDTLGTLELRDRVKIVVNRSTLESSASIDKLVGILRSDMAYAIPDDFAAVSRSLNEGIPLVSKRSKSAASKAVFKMAAAIDCGRDSGENGRKPRKSIFPLGKKRGRAE
ncbi:MAG TPA: P-loop NTPase [Bacillales bacterium]|nr:P-loop NTPase [Bacillales bacterium]